MHWRRATTFGCLMALASGTMGQADTLKLTGTLRDFKDNHPDFEQPYITGLVPGITTMTLDADGKPMLNSDVLTMSNKPVDSATSFSQWFRNVETVNRSIPYSIILEDYDGDGIYRFEASKRNGRSFFPLDNQLFGNQNRPHNYHFSYEIDTKFTYQDGQVFSFSGDDDVWVYINGTKVIDLGGVHAEERASVLLFDGKAFVEKAHFPLGGLVKEVSSTLESKFRDKWNTMQLPGTCPIQQGDRFVELDTGSQTIDTKDAIITCSFSGTSVYVESTKDLSNVVLKYSDGTEQKFDGLTGYTGIFAGTDENTGKDLIGCWVKSGDNPSGDGPGYGQWFPANLEDRDLTLDFHFTERHTTESNFTIETSIQFLPPLYD